MIQPKSPLLLSLDFTTGLARRYWRRFDVSGAGLGWRLECATKAEFDPKLPLSATSLEHFRVSGHVG